MRVYLNAGFGEPIGQPDLDLIYGLYFAGVRQDVPSVSDIPTLVGEFGKHPLVPMFLVKGTATAMVDVAQQIARTTNAWHMPAIIEVGNEMDLEEWTPRMFGATVAAAYAAIRSENPFTTVVSGGISNTSKKAIEWLREASGFLPKDIVIGFHSYREDPEEPKRGYGSRGEEFEALHEAAEGRPVWCTEFGYHTAPNKGILCIKWGGLTDEQVEEYVDLELQIQRRNNVGLSVLYQLNDGPTNTPVDRYGIRRTDGTLKPVAYVLGNVP